MPSGALPLLSVSHSHTVLSPVPGLDAQETLLLGNNVLKRSRDTLGSIGDLSHLRNQSLLLSDTCLSLISYKCGTDNANFCRS